MSVSGQSLTRFSDRLNDLSWEQVRRTHPVTWHGVVPRHPNGWAAWLKAGWAACNFGRGRCQSGFSARRLSEASFVPFRRAVVWPCIRGFPFITCFDEHAFHSHALSSAGAVFEAVPTSVLNLRAYFSAWTQMSKQGDSVPLSAVG